MTQNDFAPTSARSASSKRSKTISYSSRADRIAKQVMPKLTTPEFIRLRAEIEAELHEVATQVLESHKRLMAISVAEPLDPKELLQAQELARESKDNG